MVRLSTLVVLSVFLQALVLAEARWSRFRSGGQNQKKTPSGRPLRGNWPKQPDASQAANEDNPDDYDVAEATEPEIVTESNPVPEQETSSKIPTRSQDLVDAPIKDVVDAPKNDKIDAPKNDIVDAPTGDQDTNSEPQESVIPQGDLTDQAKVDDVLDSILNDQADPSVQADLIPQQVLRDFEANPADEAAADIVLEAILSDPEPLPLQPDQFPQRGFDSIEPDPAIEPVPATSESSYGDTTASIELDSVPMEIGGPEPEPIPMMMDAGPYDAFVCAHSLQEAAEICRSGLPICKFDSFVAGGKRYFTDDLLPGQGECVRRCDAKFGLGEANCLEEGAQCFPYVQGCDCKNLDAPGCHPY